MADWKLQQVLERNKTKLIPGWRELRKDRFQNVGMVWKQQGTETGEQVAQNVQRFQLHSNINLLQREKKKKLLRVVF